MERLRPDRSIWASESLTRNLTRVLTREFALRTNEILGQLPDGYSLASLAAPWEWRVRSHVKGKFDFPSEEWIVFMGSITEKEVKQFCSLINRVMFRTHVQTVGQMRDITSGNGYYFGLGPQVGKPFAYLAFRKHEAENLTLGL